MATSVKQSSILLVEFVDSYGNSIVNWRLDDPQLGLTRAQVETACQPAFEDYNSCGYNFVRSSSGGDAATGLGKIQTIETNIVTTDL